MPYNSKKFSIFLYLYCCASRHIFNKRHLTNAGTWLAYLQTEVIIFLNRNSSINQLSTANPLYLPYEIKLRQLYNYALW